MKKCKKCGKSNNIFIEDICIDCYDRTDRIIAEGYKEREAKSPHDKYLKVTKGDKKLAAELWSRDPFKKRSRLF